MDSPLNRETYDKLIQEIRDNERSFDILGTEYTPFKESKAKQIRKSHIEKAEEWASRQNRYIRERVMDRDTYADLQYHRIMNAIAQMENLSSRHNHQGWWIVQAFVQENYSEYGVKFIKKIEKSPLFSTLVDPLELYDNAKTENMANDFIERLGNTIGADLSESHDVFGTLYDDEDEDE